jgi:hypothetical protein
MSDDTSIRSTDDINSCWAWWYMSVILATQEAEIRRIEVQSLDHETLSRKNPSQN